MAVFGICMMRDEADVAHQVITHMLSQVDTVIVADNGSTDGTRELLDELPIHVVDDPDRGYWQSAKMTRLAQLAGDQGAAWVVPFDADELWYSPGGQRIGDVLGSLAPEFLMAEAAVYDHVTSSRDDPAESDPFRRIGWRRLDPLPLPKVACRVRPDLTVEAGNHSAVYSLAAPRVRGLLCVRHFPYRSAGQFIRKARNGAAAYAATDLPETVGAHWRAYGRILDESGEEALTGVYREWFHLSDPRKASGVIFDPAPCLAEVSG